MKKRVLLPSILLSSLLLVGCGGSSSPSSTDKEVNSDLPITNPQETTSDISTNVVADAPQVTTSRLNQELYGFSNNKAPIASGSSQSLADLLFSYLIVTDNEKYIYDGAYDAFHQLSDEGKITPPSSLLSLSVDEFNTKFVLGFYALNSGSSAEENNPVTYLKQGLSYVPSPVSRAAQARAVQRRGVEKKIEDFTQSLVRNRTFYVYSAIVSPEFNIDKAVTEARYKMGWFSGSMDLSINDGFMTASSTFGDFKMWIEFIDNDHCLEVVLEDSKGTENLSYWFVNESDFGSVASAEQAKTICYQNGADAPGSNDSTGDDTPTTTPGVIDRDDCSYQTVYAKSPVVGVCHPYPAACAIPSHWNLCDEENADVVTSTPTDTNTGGNDNTAPDVTIGMDVTGLTLNSALIEAYKVALQSDVIITEVIALANEHSELATIFLDTIKKEGIFAERVAPKMGTNQDFGEALFALMKENKSVNSYIFSALDSNSYKSLTDGLLLSQTSSKLFADILESDKSLMQDGGAFEQLFFNIGTSVHGDANENSNEKLLRALFQNSGSASDLFRAINHLDSAGTDKYMKFLFEGIKDGVANDEQRYYNLSAMADGMAVGIRQNGKIGYLSSTIIHFGIAAGFKSISYSKAMLNIGDDYLSKTDVTTTTETFTSNRDNFSGAVQEFLDDNNETDTTLTVNAPSDVTEIFGTQYNSEEERIAALIDGLEADQITNVKSYSTSKYYTDTTATEYWTYLPSQIENSNEVLPLKGATSLALNFKDGSDLVLYFVTTNSSLDSVQSLVGSTDVIQLSSEYAQSSTQKYSVYKLNASDVNSLTIDMKNNLHLFLFSY
jgi:hypothetical protein